VSGSISVSGLHYQQSVSASSSIQRHRKLGFWQLSGSSLCLSSSSQHYSAPVSASAALLQQHAFFISSESVRC
jgi:hypothetical protein